MTNVLTGLQVVEFSVGWSAGAWAGRLLAELGADVIKVEPPEGDPLRRPPGAERFAALQAGKRLRAWPAGRDGVTPPTDGNLPDSPNLPDGPRWLVAALDRADVIIDGYPLRPAPAWRPLVDAAAARRPDLIVCQVSVFGRTGPLADSPANELTCQAWGGVIDSTGYPDGPPARAGVPVGEQAGGLYATAGVLAALIERESSGFGQTLDLATFDCLIGYLGTFLPAYFHSGERPERIGNRHTSLAPWNVYPVREGWLIICSGTDAQWRQIAALIGRPDLADHPLLKEQAIRVQNSASADEAIAAWTSRRSAAEVAAAFDAIGIPNGPILTVGDLLADEHFRARGLIRDLPDGTPSVGPIFKLSAVDAPALPVSIESEADDAPLGWTPRHPTTAGRQLGADQPSEPGEAETLQRPGPPSALGRAPAAPGSGPLRGLRLLELASYTAGPYCGRILAGLGAEVIKVEPPAGDSVRRFGYRIGGDGYLFHVNNGDTHSLTLDTRTESGRQILLELARRSDAFFENFAAGTLDRQGLGADDLLAVNPTLVYASVNGFGRFGPLRDRRAYDTVIQGLAGIMHLTGPTDQPPVKVGISIADLVGATGAATAILAALYFRRRTGVGQVVDVSMHDLAGWLTAEYWPLAAQPAQADYRPGNGHPHQAPHGLYPARDGWVALAVTRAEEWTALRGLVGTLPDDPALQDAAERKRRESEIEAALGAWVAAQTVDQVVTACLTAGLPAAPVLNPADAVELPQAWQRGLIVSAHHPVSDEEFRQISLPFHFSRSATGVRGSAPPLGNANQRVLVDLLGLAPVRERAIP